MLGTVLDQRGGNALGHHADGVIDKRTDEAAGEKAALVVDDDGRLLELGNKVQRLRQRGIRSLLAANDFHQRHLVGRREEMKADKAIWPLACLRQQADGQGRGIAGQHAAGRQHGVQLLGDLGLDGAVFKHGFDHHVGIAQQLVVGAGCDAGKDGIGLLTGLAALVHQLGQHFFGVLLALLGGGLLTVNQHHVNAALRRHQCNACTHHARADHAQLAALERLKACGAVHAFFGLGLVDEQRANHAARHGAAREHGHVLALDAQALVDGQLAAFVDAALNAQRRWHVVIGLGLQHGVAHHESRSHTRVQRAAAGNAKAFHIPWLLGCGVGQQPGLGGAQQLLGRYHFVDQTSFLGLHRLQLLAFHQERHGRQNADHARQTLRAARARQQADLRFWQADHDRGRIGRNAVMAGQADFVATAQRHAVNRSD